MELINLNTKEDIHKYEYYSQDEDCRTFYSTINELIEQNYSKLNSEELCVSAITDTKLMMQTISQLDIEHKQFSVTFKLDYGYTTEVIIIIKR